MAFLPGGRGTLRAVFAGMRDRLETNAVVGGPFANDVEGLALTDPTGNSPRPMDAAGCTRFQFVMYLGNHGQELSYWTLQLKSFSNWSMTSLCWVSSRTPPESSSLNTAPSASKVWPS